MVLLIQTPSCSTWGRFGAALSKQGLAMSPLNFGIWQVYCRRRHGRGEFAFLWAGRCTFLLTSTDPGRIICCIQQNGFFLTDSNPTLTGSSPRWMLPVPGNTRRSSAQRSDFCGHVCLPINIIQVCLQKYQWNFFPLGVFTVSELTVQLTSQFWVSWLNTLWFIMVGYWRVYIGCWSSAI